MPFSIQVETVGELRENCYVVKNPVTQECVLIDPGDEAETIRAAMGGCTLRAILLTHGHFDHIGAVEALAAPGVEIVIHREDAPFLSDTTLNASDLCQVSITCPPATRLVEDGDSITYAGLTFQVMHTPGHTQGSACYRMEDVLFSGDTIFLDGFGRTDLATGSALKIRESLRHLRPVLPQVHLYPGHGGQS